MMRDVHQLTVGTDSIRLTDVRRRLKAIFIGSIGNLVEWYDFYAYTAFALYFAESFFPGNDPVVQQLNAALLFAAGFVMRPIGGWLFGHLADHHGRRNALMLSVLLMCLGSLVIAVTPTYASIGGGSTDAAGAGAGRPGFEPRRRVWCQRHIPHGSGRP
jgi:MHS family alpha-ketoglutarate permease-like MFS transporter